MILIYFAAGSHDGDPSFNVNDFSTSTNSIHDCEELADCSTSEPWYDFLKVLLQSYLDDEIYNYMLHNIMLRLFKDWQ